MLGLPPMRYRNEHATYGTYIRRLVSAPFIFGLIIPLVFLDVCVEIYHRVGFWLYRLPYIKRSAYIQIQRQKLAYLTWYEKIFCLYCSYANGLLPYAAAIAAATERYFCGIRNKPEAGFHEPAHHASFAPYGDKEAFERMYTPSEHTPTHEAPQVHFDADGAHAKKD